METHFDPTYNTLMALAAGLSLVLLVALGYRLHSGRTASRHGWAGVFFALGAILAFLGGVMTVTWPLSGPTAFDNINFGEPSLAMGVILLVGSVLLGRDRYWIAGPATATTPAGPDSERPIELSRTAWPRLSDLLWPLSCFAFVMGLALIAIVFVGPVFEPWEAPPQEPISSLVAGTPWVENTFISILYGLTGIGALLTPFALARESIDRALGLLKVIGACWLVAGTIWVIFGAMNYYTHIGLEIHTYEEQQQQVDLKETP